MDLMVVELDYISNPSLCFLQLEEQYVSTNNEKEEALRWSHIYKAVQITEMTPFPCSPKTYTIYTMNTIYFNLHSGDNTSTS